MGIHIVLGFGEKKGDANPLLLYLGNDADAARGEFQLASAGIFRKEIFNRPAGRVRYNDSGEGAELKLPELFSLSAQIPENASVEDVAALIYEAYCAAVGGKAYNGDALPSWEEFRADEKKKVQSDAWVKVAGLLPATTDEVEVAKELGELHAEVVSLNELLVAERKSGGEFAERVNGELNELKSQLGTLGTDLSLAQNDAAKKGERVTELEGLLADALKQLEEKKSEPEARGPSEEAPGGSENLKLEESAPGASADAKAPKKK